MVTLRNEDDIRTQHCFGDNTDGFRRHCIYLGNSQIPDNLEAFSFHSL